MRWHFRKTIVAAQVKLAEIVKEAKRTGVGERLSNSQA